MVFLVLLVYSRDSKPVFLFDSSTELEYRLPLSLLFTKCKLAFVDKADCTVTISDDDFVQLMTGKLNPQTVSSL